MSLLRWLAIVAIAALLAAVAGGFYGWHRAQVGHAAALAAAKAKYDAQVAETSRIQNKWDEAVLYGAEQRALKVLALDDVDRVTGKLRAYAARQRALSCTARAPAGAGSPGPEPDELADLGAAIGRAREAFERDAAADAADFAAIRDLYNRLRAAQVP